MCFVDGHTLFLVSNIYHQSRSTKFVFLITADCNVLMIPWLCLAHLKLLIADTHVHVQHTCSGLIGQLCRL